MPQCFAISTTADSTGTRGYRHRHPLTGYAAWRSCLRATYQGLEFDVTGGTQLAIPAAIAPRKNSTQRLTRLPWMLAIVGMSGRMRSSIVNRARLSDTGNSGWTGSRSAFGG